MRQHRHGQKELVHLLKLVPVLRVPSVPLHLFQTMKPVVNYVQLVRITVSYTVANYVNVVNLVTRVVQLVI